MRDQYQCMTVVVDQGKVELNVHRLSVVTDNPKRLVLKQTDQLMREQCNMFWPMRDECKMVRPMRDQYQYDRRSPFNDLTMVF